MVGREAKAVSPPAAAKPGNIRLKVEGLAARDASGVARLKDALILPFDELVLSGMQRLEGRRRPQVERRRLPLA